MFASLYVKVMGALLALNGPPTSRVRLVLMLADLATAALTQDPFFIVCAAQGAGWLE
jgi:hypothetical protein